MHFWGGAGGVAGGVDVHAGGGADPFVEAAALPADSRALDSCLWEVESLRSHYAPSVSAVANAFAKPFTSTTPPMHVELLAELDADALHEREAHRRVRAAPLAARRPKRLALLDDGFGVPPPTPE